MKYYVNLEKEDDLYVVTIPDLNGTSTYGNSIELALLNAKDAAELYLEADLEFPENKYCSDYFIEVS